MEEKVIYNTGIEDSPMVEVPKEKKTTRAMKSRVVVEENNDGLVSCLRNEKIKVRYIPKSTGLVGNNERHVLSGGMAEGAKITYVVPKLNNGTFVNVLTDTEKSFLESYMGLEYGALSIYKRPEEENFWNDANPNGINKVELRKQDNYLDLSLPQDYIKYKILLANKNFICPSLSALKETPKATYRFVIIAEGEESKQAKSNMNNTMLCYKAYGKIEDKIDLLRMIVETLDGRPTAATVKLEFLQNKCNEFIQKDAKKFLSVINDPLLETKSLIKIAIEEGLIANRGNYLYLRSDNTPLCEQNEEPTLNFAAKYLNAPKHQDLLFSLQARLNK